MDELIDDIPIEISACESFKIKLESKFNNKIPLYKGTLDSIDSISCQDVSENKHIILLYLHVDGNVFSEEFCAHLKNEHLLQEIDKHCYFLAWDLNGCNVKSLLSSVKCTLGFNTIYKNVSEKKPSIYFLTPIEHEIIEVIDKTFLVKHFPFNLKRLIKSVCSNTEEVVREVEKQSDDISSERFQQTMYELIGDRDFDSFEYDEHDYLKNKLYFAIYGSPDSCEKDEEKEQVLNDLYGLIRKTNNEYSKWNDRIVISFIYNCTESTKSFIGNMTPIPVFSIRKCKGSKNSCRKYIDLDLRVYNSWKHYLIKNKMPKCNMIVPKNGRYQGDSRGNVLLEHFRSPSYTNTAYALRYMDIIMTILGIIAAILMVVSIVYNPIMISAGILGLTCAIYSMTRTAFQIHDRRKHRMNMSIKNPDARGAYLNIAANSIGLIGGALTRTVAIVASRGVVIGKSMLMTANAINYAGLATDFVGIMNSLHAMKTSKRPDALQFLQFSFSILFFNNSIINIARTRGQLVQAEISSSIKVSKSTKIQNPNNQTVSHLRSIHSQDLIKVLGSRGNRLSEAKLITFSTANGKLSLNDVPVTVLKQTAVRFQGMSLPPMQYITEVIQKKYLTDEEDVRLYEDVLFHYPHTTKEHVFKIVEKLLVKLKEEQVEHKNAIKKIFPQSTFTCKIMEISIQFLERKFENECDLCDSLEENKSKLFRMIESVDLNEILIDLVQFYLDWLTTAIYEFEQANVKRAKRREMQMKYKEKVNCTICGGFYYKNSK
nr:uncharacterized protein LOC111419914 [Onthophagus taurus]